MKHMKKTLGVYYHMPFKIEDANLFGNPVMGTFVESLAPHFKKILLFGFESISDSNQITYRINDDRIDFVSLGPQGQLWDYIHKIKRVRNIIKKNSNNIDYFLFRVPSHLAYAIWKYALKPKKVILLFVGNPYFTSDYSNRNVFMYFFRKYRSFAHDYKMKMLCKNSSAIVLANSDSLVKIWMEKLDYPVSIIQTSSLSKKYINHARTENYFKNDPYKLLFVGRVCYDKGIRELFRALKELNNLNDGKYILDILGPIGDIGGFTFDKLASNYEVQNYINYQGVVPFGEEIFKFYKKSDAYILPSYHEGMPHAIWEAMSQGTPVISTPVGGIGDAFVDKRDIIFARVKDHKSIVKSVIKLKGNKILRNSLIKNGYLNSTNVTSEAQTERILEIMDKYWKNFEE